MGVLRRSAAAIWRHPLRSLLVLGVAPTLWSLPETLLQDRPELAPIWPALAFRTAATAWTALLAGGSVIASIELAAGGRPTLGALVRGVRFSPAVFVALVFHVVPMEILARTTDAPQLVMLFALLVVTPAMLVLVLRGLAWIPLIVDRRLGAMQAFGASWAATRGSGARIFVISIVLGAAAASTGLAIALAHPFAAHAVGLVLFPVSSVVLAEVYLALSPDRGRKSAERVPLSESMTPAPPAEDLPTKGSGWTRDAGRSTQQN